MVHCPKWRHTLKLFWILCGVGIPVLLLFWIGFSTESIEKVISQQLEALKKGQVSESYFLLTSQDFQEKIPLEKYQQFIRTYPILTHHQNILFGKQNIDGNRAFLTLFLKSNGQDEAEAHYQLQKVNQHWKIDRLELTEYRKGSSEQAVNVTAAMIAPIEAQLKSLKNHDFLGGYKSLVSQEFMRQTPFASFKAFVLSHPILIHYEESEFKEHSLENGRGKVTLLLNPEKENVAVEYRMIQEDGQWKILMMRLDNATESPSKPEAETAQTPPMIDLVRNALALFNEGKIKQVYEDFIAKEIQAEVPFEQFQKFVLKYSALTKHKAVNIRDPKIESGVGRLVAEVVDEKGTTIVEYNLAIESGRWKILGMHIASTPEEPGAVTPPETSPTAYRVRDLIGVIEEFLSALRSHDSIKAYNFTSKDFQYANTQADFDQFFAKHPAFSESKGSYFEKETFNNSIATFSGQLLLSDEHVMPVEFDLVYEEGRWKILHLYALPSHALSSIPQTSSSTQSSLEFGTLQLGTKVDDEGHILNPITHFKSDAGDLYVSLNIVNGSVGTEITLLLRHIESGSVLKPVRAILTDNGSSSLTFLFSPPPKGWPKGNYQLRASSSTQVHKTFTFTVE